MSSNHFSETKMGEIMGQREETWNLVLYQLKSNPVMVLGKQGQKKKVSTSKYKEGEQFNKRII